MIILSKIHISTEILKNNDKIINNNLYYSPGKGYDIKPKYVINDEYKMLYKISDIDSINGIIKLFVRDLTEQDIKEGINKGLN